MATELIGITENAIFVVIFSSMCWPTCANYAFSIMSSKNLMNSSPIWNIWGICSAYIITGLKYAAGSFRELHLHAGTQLYSVLFQFIVFYLCSRCVPKNRALWGQSIACFLCLFLWTESHLLRSHTVYAHTFVNIKFLSHHSFQLSKCHWHLINKTGTSF